MKFVVLGGTGAMGRVTVRDLYDSSRCEIVIAERNLKKAEAYAERLGSRVAAEHVDARERHQLARILRDCDAVLNCANYYFNLDVMEAALMAHVHYLDLGGLFHMTRKQLLLHHRFQSIRKLALLGCGSTPGITNVMAAHGASLMDAVREIHVSFGAKDFAKHDEPFLLPYTLQTVFDEFMLQPALLAKGRLRMVEPMSGRKHILFPKPIGRLEGFYTLHSELATFPLSFKQKGLRECSFRVTFDEEFVERIKFLIDAGFASDKLLEVGNCVAKPRDFAAKVLDQWIPKTVDDLEIVRVELLGKKRGKRKRLTLDCVTRSNRKHGFSAGAWDTGVPLSIMGQMVARGNVADVGAMAPESCMPTKTFFDALKKRNIMITVRGD